MASERQSPSLPEPCHLLKLPPELRLRIYEYYFGTRNLYYLLWSAEPRECRSFRSSIAADRLEAGPAILRTCSLIHTEAFPVFIDRTIVDFDFGQAEIQSGWFPPLESLGFMKDIRKVQIDTGCRDMTDWKTVLGGFFGALKVLEEGKLRRKLCVYCSELGPSPADEEWFRDILARLAVKWEVNFQAKEP